MTAIVDYMVNGYWQWSGAKAHHFPSTTVTFNVEGLTAARMPLALSALDAWHNAIGLNFIRVWMGGDIIFDDLSNGGARSEFVASHGLTVQATVNVPDAPSHGLSTFVHEIGHAIGLGHPGPYNGIYAPIFSDDNGNNSVMSYGQPTATEPKPYDIAAWVQISAMPLNVPTYQHPANLLIGGLDAVSGVDRDWYFSKNLDVYYGGWDAAMHFNAAGKYEGRNPNWGFDFSYYLSHNPDVAAAGVNAWDHYREFGWHEGRDPSELFDVSSYLAANPDVAAAGVDPLEHYLVFGIEEGRPSWLVS